MSRPTAPPPLPPKPLPPKPLPPTPQPAPRRPPRPASPAAPVEVAPSPGVLRGARKPAIAGILLGTVLISVNLAAMGSGNVFFPKALAIGVAVAHVGLAMFLFPGAVDLPMFSARRIPLATILEGLEPTERLAWLGATVYGVGLGVLVAAAL